MRITRLISRESKNHQMIRSIFTRYATFKVRAPPARGRGRTLEAGYCDGNPLQDLPGKLCLVPGRGSRARPLPDRFVCLPRKEVIQPHLPVRLPCYDFTPLTLHTFGASPLAVGPATSGADDSGGVTGGVYKARERIHRGVLIRDY